MEKDDIVYFVDNESDEWEYMWKKLGKHPLNKHLGDPSVAYNEGECWQYMDTSIYDNKLKHCFRHRCHPNTNGYMYVQIIVSETFSVEKDCRKGFESAE